MCPNGHRSNDPFNCRNAELGQVLAGFRQPIQIDSVDVHPVPIASHGLHPLELRLRWILFEQADVEPSSGVIRVIS